MKINKLLPVLTISVVVNAILAAALLSPQIAKLKADKLDLTKKVTTTQTNNISGDNLFDEINPVAGYEIDVKYGNLGPKMTALGVIDPEKFKNVYEKSNQPLTLEQEEILMKGSDGKIKITRENSYFLLNFLWAVGLSNKSKSLDEGDMMKYGGKQGAGNFASTG